MLRPELNNICKKCNKIFEQTPSTHLAGKGCPLCNTLGKISEPKLFNFIKDKLPGINVISQGKPEWLKYKTNSQSFDIYLPDHGFFAHTGSAMDLCTQLCANMSPIHFKLL